MAELGEVTRALLSITRDSADDLVVAAQICHACVDGLDVDGAAIWLQTARPARQIADVATISILQERAIRRGEVLNEQLQAALTSRVVIEQAKGVVAQYSGLDLDQAFARLRSYARNRNLKLGDVARHVVRGTLDPAALGRLARPERRPAP